MGARFVKDDLIASAKRGDLRKATRNMLMAHAVVEKVLQPFPQLIPEFRSNIGVILGTGHGELETTKEYLKCYRQQRAARPLLFQNSLHNSTLGFLSQAFGFTGPVVTQSNLFFTGEKALDTAVLLLRGGQALFCLVIGVDALVPDIQEPFRLIYPASIEPGEGCAAVLLAGEEGLERLPSTQTKGMLDKIYYEQNKNEVPWGHLDSYYDSDAIEKLVLALEKSDSSGKLSLQKPDGSCSVIEFSQ